MVTPLLFIDYTLPILFCIFQYIASKFKSRIKIPKNQSKACNRKIINAKLVNSLLTKTLYHLSRLVPY